MRRTEGEEDRGKIGEKKRGKESRREGKGKGKMKNIILSLR